MAKAGSLAKLQHEIRAHTLVMTLSDPTNSLSGDLLADLQAQVSIVPGQADLRGVVLILRGGHSVAPDLSASLGAVCLALESLTKPVIAVLEGWVGGALWALALAAHYRFADSETQILCPEARLGFLPGGGITQRLPRLIGAAEAIGMMLSSRPETAQTLRARGALDRVCAAGALAEAEAALAAGLPPRPTRHERRAMQDGRGYLTEVQAFRDRVSGDPLDVSRAVVRAVEAALLLPFAQGLAFEAVTLEDLAAAPETRAVAHANQVDRVVRERLRVLAGAVKAAAAPGVSRLGLWRSGPERADLVVQALSKGMTVALGDPDRAVLTALQARVAALQEAMVAQKILTPEARDADRARLFVVDDAGGLAACDLILLAQPDFPRSMTSPGTGKAVALVALGHIARDPDPLPALLPATGPGGHAELSLATGYAPHTVGQVLDLARKLGWRCQQVGPNGFIAHRLRRVLRALPVQLKDLGFDARQITQGMAAAGLGAQPAGKHRTAEGKSYDIAHLAMAAVANEAARILGEGLGLSSAEVDAAALAAGILPRWKGGPLFQADLRGLILLRVDLQRLAGAGDAAIAPLIEDLIQQGRRFYPPDPAS